jgi:hypothetical protein
LTRKDTEHWILEGKQIKLMLLQHVVLDKKIDEVAEKSPQQQLKVT